MKGKKRTMFSMLRNNRGEVDGEEETPAEEVVVEPSLQDVIEESLENPEAEETPKEEETPAEKPAGEEEVVPKEGEEGYVKPEDKPADEEDPTMDLGYDVDGKPGKMTIKDAQANLKWIKDNVNTIGSMLKMREMADKNPEFGKLLNKVVDSSFNDKDELNAEFVTSSLAKLDAKAEVVEDKIIEKDEDIEEMEELLKELDPDSSQALTYKKSIKIMKAQKERLEEQSVKITSFAERLDKMDKTAETATKTEADAKHNEAVEQHRKTFNTEFDETVKDVKFINDSEKEQFRGQVKGLIQDTVGKLEKAPDDALFKKIIGESVKTVTKSLDESHQAIINRYLKSKGKPILEEINPKKEESPPIEDFSQAGLQGRIEKMLEEGEAKE